MDAEPIATAAIERATVPVDGVFNLLDVIAVLGVEIFRDKGGQRRAASAARQLKIANNKLSPIR